MRLKTLHDISQYSSGAPRLQTALNTRIAQTNKFISQRRFLASCTRLQFHKLVNFVFLERKKQNSLKRFVGLRKYISISIYATELCTNSNKSV